MPRVITARRSGRIGTGGAFIATHYSITQVTNMATGATTEVYNEEPDLEGPLFEHLQASSASKLCAYDDGNIPPDYNPSFVYSLNGGASWSVGYTLSSWLSDPGFYYQFLRMDYADSDMVWGCDGQSGVYSVHTWHTNDGGTNWIETTNANFITSRRFQQGFCAPRHDGATAFSAFLISDASPPGANPLCYVDLMNKDGTIAGSQGWTPPDANQLNKGCVRYGDTDNLYYVSFDGYLYKYTWSSNSVVAIGDVPQLPECKDLVSTRLGTLLIVDSWWVPPITFFYIYRSPDGVNWTLIDLSASLPDRGSSYDSWDRVCVDYNNDLFIPLDNSSHTNIGGFYSADDGVSWEFVGGSMSSAYAVEDASGIGGAG